jgi:hypothetical protein
VELHVGNAVLLVNGANAPVAPPPVLVPVLVVALAVHDEPDSVALPFAPHAVLPSGTSIEFGVLDSHISHIVAENVLLELVFPERSGFPGASNAAGLPLTVVTSGQGTAVSKPPPEVQPDELL